VCAVTAPLSFLSFVLFSFLFPLGSTLVWICFSLSQALAPIFLFSFFMIGYTWIGFFGKGLDLLVAVSEKRGKEKKIVVYVDYPNFFCRSIATLFFSMGLAVFLGVALQLFSMWMGWYEQREVDNSWAHHIQEALVFFLYFVAAIGFLLYLLTSPIVSRDEEARRILRFAQKHSPSSPLCLLPFSTKEKKGGKQVEEEENGKMSYDVSEDTFQWLFTRPPFPSFLFKNIS